MLIISDAFLKMIYSDTMMLSQLLKDFTEESGKQHKLLDYRKDKQNKILFMLTKFCIK